MDGYILKAIKDATGTSVIFPINISLIHCVLVLTSVSNIPERFTKKLELNCAFLPKNLVKKDKFIKFFGNHIQFQLEIKYSNCVSLKQTKIRNTTQNSLCGKDLKLMF